MRNAFVKRTHPVIYLIIALCMVLLIRGVIAADLIIIGDDTASYLAYAQALRGTQDAPGAWWHHGIGAAYLLVFNLAAGIFTGSKLAALTASILLAIPVFFWAKEVSNYLLAFFVAVWAIWSPDAAFLLASAWMYLLSAAIGLTSIYFAILYTKQRDRLLLIASMGLTAALTFTNQSSLFVFGPVAVFAWAYVLFPDRLRIILYAFASFAAFTLMAFAFLDSLRNPTYFSLGMGLIIAGSLLVKKTEQKPPALIIALFLFIWSVVIAFLVMPDNQALQGLFGRAMSFIYISGGLIVSAFLMRYTIKRAYGFLLGFGVIAISALFWTFAFNAMSEEHSTLTHTTLQSLRSTENLEGVIGVHPFMMARYVELFDGTENQKKVLQTFPEGVDLTPAQYEQNTAIRCAADIAHDKLVDLNECLNALSIDYLVLKNGDVVEIHDLRPFQQVY